MIASYRKIVKKRVIWLTLFTIFTGVFFLLNISWGSSHISLSEVWQILWTRQGIENHPLIIYNVRLPMACMAIGVGAALAVGGCEIQTILRSPIASPFTLGITSAATFGASLGLLLKTNIAGISDSVVITANAFFFSTFASMGVYFFSRRRVANKQTIILFGVALNFLFSSLTMIVQYISDDEDLQSLVFWNMGSLLKSTWNKVHLVFLILIPVMIILYFHAWKISAMALNEVHARSLGVPVSKIRRLVIICSALTTAVAVSFVGTIGFVGIVAPHIARRVVGEDQRFLLPASALVGAMVVSGAFMVSKLVIPGVILPIGLVTSLLGIPFLLFLIFKQGGLNA